MKKIKQFACILTSLSLSFCLFGCNSDDKESSKEETIAETTEAVTEELTTEEITEPPVEELTEPESTEVELELFEEDETIVNLLKAGYSFEGMGIPTINFSTQTNTYIVIAPTSSDSIGKAFDSANGDESWDNYVEKFTELNKSIVNTITQMHENENINFQVIHTLKTPAPLIAYENEKIVFDLYNSDANEQAIFILKTQLGINFIKNFDYTDISFDSNLNTYTIKFYINGDTAELFKSESLTKPFTELNAVLRNMIISFDNPNLIFNAVELGTDVPIYTVENGEVTYNIFD